MLKQHKPQLSKNPNITGCMKILSSTLYKGINPYAHFDVTKLLIDFAVTHDINTMQAGLPFCESLIQYLPGLEKRAFMGEKAGETASRMKCGIGLHLADLIWRVAIELQKKIEVPVSYGMFKTTRDPHIYEVVYEYRDSLLGEKAGLLAVALIQKHLLPPFQEKDRPAINFDFEKNRNPLSHWQSKRRMDLNTRYILDAAMRKDIPFMRIDSKIAQLGQGIHRRFVRSAATELLPMISYAMTEDKALTVSSLARLGLPVPRQVVCASLDAVKRAAERIGFPLVIKPKDSYTGLGVTTRITSIAEIEPAFVEAIKYSQRVIVETFIPGDDHRLLVINNEMVAAVKRIPAHVIGDGEHTVRELVEKTNKARQACGRRSKYNIKLDAFSDRMLAKQGLQQSSVPGKDEQVFLRSASNYSQGGLAIDVTDEVHPDNIALAVRASAAFSMDIAGIDFITTDIRQSYKTGAGAICEVGSRPGLLLHTEPDAGMAREVGIPVIDMLFPVGNGRIPIVAVGGARQKQLVARMLSNLLSSAGFSVGLAMKPEVFINGTSLGKADLKSHEAAQIILQDPTVDLAIFEVNVQHLASYGLGYDQCEVTAITNIEKDADLTPFNALLKATRQKVILHADSDSTSSLLNEYNAKSVLLVSHSDHPHHIQEHLDKGGQAIIAVHEPSGLIINYHEGSNRRFSVPSSSMPFMGDFSNKENINVLHAALFAIASALALGLPYESLLRGLKVLTTKNPLPIICLEGYPFEVLLADALSPDVSARLTQMLPRLGSTSNTKLVLDDGALGQLGRDDGIKKKFIACFDRAVLVPGSALNLLYPLESVPAPTIFSAIEKGFALADPSDLLVIFTSRFSQVKKLLYTPIHLKHLKSSAHSSSQATHESVVQNNPYSATQGEPIWYADELAAAVQGEWINHPGPGWFASGVTYFDWGIRPGDLMVSTNKEQWPKKYDDLNLRIDDLFRRGASAVIVSKSPPEMSLNAPYPLLLVSNTRKALDQLGAYAIRRLAAKVAAITGSVGKSTTTTMLAYLLGQQGKTHSTIKNFNSTPGVPLTAARTPRDSKFAVYEVGIGRDHRANELRGKMLSPDVVLITTIQPDHIEFYKTIEGIINAKTDIAKEVKANGVVIINREDSLYDLLRSRLHEKGVRTIYTFGEHPEADFRLANIQIELAQSRAEVTIGGKTESLVVPHPGRHMLLNAVAALATLYALGADWQKAADDLASVPKMEGRAEIYDIPLDTGTYQLIDDAYSANPASMRSALTLLTLQKPTPGGRRLALLGEMKELGEASEQLHLELLDPLIEARLDRVYMLGEGIKPLWDRLPQHLKGVFALTAQSIIEDLEKTVRPGDIVLVKGSARSSVAMLEILTRLKKPRGKDGNINKRARQLSTSKNSTREGCLVKTPTDPAKGISLLMLGDTAFGENYQTRIAARGGENLLESKGYDFPLANFKDFLLQADIVVANLETPLTTQTKSPFTGVKRYIHHSDPVQATQCLLRHNIKHVMLANNHSYDFGVEGFIETLEALEQHGIAYTGAGRNLQEAVRPLCFSISHEGNAQEVVIISAYQWSKMSQDLFNLFASNNNGGINPMVVEKIKEQVSKARQRWVDSFIIISPHWGKNYEWRSEYQRQLAHEFLNAGADLILGHGAHMIQEVEKVDSKWIIYSIGNFMLNSPGRYKMHNAPPYSFIARLNFRIGEGKFIKTLQLYPIVTDNLLTHYQSRFVNPEEFNHVCTVLEERSSSPGAIIEKKRENGHHCIELELE
jgi:cyanophycin synthetase